MPARTALITGLFPHNTGLWGNSTDFYLPPDMMPLFADVRRQGYTTSQVGKLQWWASHRYRRDFDSLESYLKGLGIDHPDDLATPFSTRNRDGPYQQHLKKIGKHDEYCADMLDRLTTGQFRPRPSVVNPEDHNDWFAADRRLEFLRRQPKDTPYFIVTSFPGLHTPPDAMGRYLARYNAQRIHLAANVRRMKYDGHDYSLDDLRACRASYLGKMTMIDDCVGRIIAAVKARGTWENTLVVFTSDHGDMMGAQGRFGKSVFWEESGRVPLLVRCPGQTNAGTKTNALVHLNDVHATVVDAVGGKPSKRHFSRSLMPVVRGDASAFQSAAFGEIAHQSSLTSMVRDPRYKWFNYAGREYLYDLQEDSLEQRNLFGSPTHRDRMINLKELQRQFITTTQVNLSADYKSLVARTREKEN